MIDLIESFIYYCIHLFRVRVWTDPEPVLLVTGVEISACAPQGELTYDGHEIKVFDFLTQTSTKHTVDMSVPGSFSKGGHGVADYHLADAFISAVAVSYLYHLHFPTPLL